jgi:hypothetical protein
MMLWLALTLQLISSAGECYYVSNTRIVVLPSCDFSPAAMAKLDAQEPPPTTAQVEAERRRRAYDAQRLSAERQRRARGAR